jgi:hypothetical protein
MELLVEDTLDLPGHVPTGKSKTISKKQAK